jgi:hypothetical protein
MPTVQELFNQFLTQRLQNDYEIRYSLLQSSVENIIRFKFGAWLQHQNWALTVNLVEINKIDLLVGFENELVIIEFGHLLNLNQPQSNAEVMKRDSDVDKVKTQKWPAIRNKIRQVNRQFLTNKKIRLFTCSLFSDFRMNHTRNGYRAVFSEPPLRNAALLKYRYEQDAGPLDYFRNYRNHINEIYGHDTFLSGYVEFPVIPEQLSLHYKFVDHGELPLNEGDV